MLKYVKKGISFLENRDRDLGLPHRLHAFFVKIANRARCAYACILTMLKCALRYLHLSVFDFLGAGVARSASLKISHTHRIWVLAEFELWL